MTRRIAVSSKVGDARARHYLASLKALFPEAPLTGVATVAAYTVDAELSQKELESAAERLTNPITEEFSLDGVPNSSAFSYCIEIGYLPGVTDNVGHTAKETIEDAIHRAFGADEGVYSSTFLFLEGSLNKRATIFSADDAKKGFPLSAPKVMLRAQTLHADEVDLDVPDEELLRIGKEGIRGGDGLPGEGTRRGPLALSLDAMKTIRGHFKKLGRKPTDVELESLAGTWSEHCKHTIFADPLDDIEDGIYRRYIKGATEKIRKAKGKRDFCVSVFKDNSGAISFDDKYLITHKVETHNAPSALDPFGGSVTAIVGVNRDCLG